VLADPCADHRVEQAVQTQGGGEAQLQRARVHDLEQPGPQRRVPVGRRLQSVDRRTQLADRRVQVVDGTVDAGRRSAGIGRDQADRALQPHARGEQALDDQVVQVPADPVPIGHHGALLGLVPAVRQLQRDRGLRREALEVLDEQRVRWGGPQRRQHGLTRLPGRTQRHGEAVEGAALRR
jgi:hypothetical protein